MMIATPTTPATTTADNRIEKSPSENAYATLFLTYINQSLAEALATVRAVETKLPDEERVQACHVLDFGLRTKTTWLQARDLVIELAPYVERSGDWENWRQQLQHAIDLADQVQDIEGKIGLMVFVARLAQRQGRLAETIYYYRRVIRLARETGNCFQEARACSNLGYALIESGHFLRSEILCKRALTIFTELQSNHGLAHTHNHLGLLYTRQKCYVLAENHLQLACTLWKGMRDTHSLFYGDMNLGLLYLEMERATDALQHLHSALHIAETSGEAVGIARVWNNLGRVHFKSHNFNLAEQYFEKARMLFSQIGDKGELAKTHYNLGLTYQHLEKWQDAFEHLEVALSLFQATQNPIDVLKALVALVAQGANPLYALAAEGHMETLTTLVTQQKTSEFQPIFRDIIAYYGSSFSDIHVGKLLQLVTT